MINYLRYLRLFEVQITPCRNIVNELLVSNEVTEVNEETLRQPYDNLEEIATETNDYMITTKRKYEDNSITIPCSIISLADNSKKHTKKINKQFKDVEILMKINPNHVKEGTLLRIYGCDIEKPLKKTSHDSISYSSEELFIKPLIVKKALQGQLALDYCNYYLSKGHEAQLLAQRFSKLLQQHYPADEGFHFLSFVQSYLVKIKPIHPANSVSYMIIEEEIDGIYENFNNKSGKCVDSPTKHDTFHEMIQAFSHWTYCYSHGLMMIVNCQGAWYGNEERFVLTNPIIHTFNQSHVSFCEECEDQGIEGMRLFFKHHQCNDYCEEFNIKNKILK